MPIPILDGGRIVIVLIEKLVASLGKYVFELLKWVEKPDKVQFTTVLLILAIVYITYHNKRKVSLSFFSPPLVALCYLSHTSY